MNDSVWSLGGPARFVHQAAAKLRSGVNVIVHTPPHAPDGMQRAIRSDLEADGYLDWIDLTDAELNCDSIVGLIAALQKHLARIKRRDDQPADGLGDINSLAKSIVDTVLWLNLDGRPAGAETDWNVWREFLERLRDANHRLEESDRGVACFMLPSRLSAGEEDVGLSVHPWRGVVNSLDVQQLSDRILSRRNGRSGSWQRLHAALVAELAGTDLRLAALLAGQSVSALIEPLPCLSDYAAAQDWLTAVEPDWSNGCSDQRGGEKLLHAGHLAASGDHESVKRLVWQAQLAVLFPYIERQRLSILPRIRNRLELPVQDGDGNLIEEAELLELGKLVHLLRNRRLTDSVWETPGRVAESPQRARPPPTGKLRSNQASVGIACLSKSGRSPNSCIQLLTAVQNGGAGRSNLAGWAVAAAARSTARTAATRSAPTAPIPTTKGAKPVKTRSKTKQISRRSSPPVMKFLPTAWAKLLYLRDCGEAEVGGFGVSSVDDLLLIEDIQLVRQSCTAVMLCMTVHGIDRGGRRRVRRPDPGTTRWRSLAAQAPSSSGRRSVGWRQRRPIGVRLRRCRGR